MYDCVQLAEALTDRDLFVTCIPVINNELEEDVAVVGLEPNLIAYTLLHDEDDRRRARAIVAVAMHSHTLLPSRGLSFRCPSSS